ncbi:hypothetical protein DJ69_12805 [Halorubrum persicum]|uniref:Uncharacterized protein n=1 Tax=Halorubrum persicum TaxID=1383844 RepID=A0A2G1WGV0_9EURY|nr:hypothetical protein DJ69_12805 [Halorubrum persicum]
MSVGSVLVVVVVRPWPVCDHSEQHHGPPARRQSVATRALPDTRGHEHHTAAGDLYNVEFLETEDRLVVFWASTDEYWDAADGDPPCPH